MEKECPVCKSTRIVKNKCARCGASVTGINSRTVCAALAIILLVLVAMSAIQNDWLIN